MACETCGTDHGCDFPPLENGAPWLKVGDKIEVLTPLGWVEVQIRDLTHCPVKYPGYVHFEFGRHMTGCVAPWAYGETWRMPAGAQQAVGL